MKQGYQLRLFGARDELDWLRDPAQRDRRRGRYTPAEVLEQVRSGIALECSDRAIAKACGLDHKTVGAVRRDMEQAGEIPQIKERLASKLLRMGERWFDIVDEQVMCGRRKPIPLEAAIALTKSQELIAGLAVPVAAVQVNITADDLRRALLPPDHTGPGLETSATALDLHASDVSSDADSSPPRT